MRVENRLRCWVLVLGNVDYMIRAVIFGIAAVLMTNVIAAPVMARDGDDEEPPVFRQLDPNEIDVSDVEIFGSDSGPVYGERLATDEATETPEQEDVADVIYELATGPRLDPRPRRMDVAEVELFDPSADEAPAPVVIAEVIEEPAPEEMKQVEEDLYAEAEALFQSLHENDIDISGVEIFDIGSNSTEVASEIPVVDEQVTAEVTAAVPTPRPTQTSPAEETITATPTVRPEAETNPVQLTEALDPEVSPTLAPNTPAPATDTIDVADVEIFSGEEDPKADEIEAREQAAELFAGADEAIAANNDDTDEFEIATALPTPTSPGRNSSVVDRSVGDRSERGHGFGSGAFPGLYSGVGVANGMRLELETNGLNVRGWLVDSAGQVFTIGGEIATLDGHAQAAVVSDSAAIGYLDLHLTNLGLGALYVPLRENLSPVVEDAKRYEFLRAMSSEAQTALAMERAERLEILASQPSQDRRRRRVVWQEEEDVWD